MGHLKTTLGSSIFSCCGSYSYSLLFNHVLLLSPFFPCYLWPFLSDSHCPDFFWPCSSLCLVWVGLFWVLKQNSWALSRGPSQLLNFFAWLSLVVSAVSPYSLQSLIHPECNNEEASKWNQESFLPVSKEVLRVEQSFPDRWPGSLRRSSVMV